MVIRFWYLTLTLMVIIYCKPSHEVMRRQVISYTRFFGPSIMRRSASESNDGPADCALIIDVRKNEGTDFINFNGKE